MLLLRFAFKPKAHYEAAMTQQISQSLKEKLRIFIPTGLLMIGCIIFMGFWFARFASVANAQKLAEDDNFPDDTVFYDVACSTAQVGGLVKLYPTLLTDSAMKSQAIQILEGMKTGDEKRAAWSDAEKAYDFMVNIQESDCDDDCMKRGTQWSTVMLMNGLMMIFIFFNLSCVIMGRIKAYFRVVAAYAGFIIFLTNLAILSVTGYLRYRPTGALCSLYTENSNVPTTNKDDVDDAWTFEKDGGLIIGLWLVQAVLMIPCCLLAVY